MTRRGLSGDGPVPDKGAPESLFPLVLVVLGLNSSGPGTVRGTGDGADVEAARESDCCCGCCSDESAAGRPAGREKVILGVVDDTRDADADADADASVGGLLLVYETEELARLRLPLPFPPANM